MAYCEFMYRDDFQLEDVKECFWHVLEALTSNEFSIGCQTRIPIGAYSLLPNPGLSVRCPTLSILMYGTQQLGVDHSPTELPYLINKFNTYICLFRCSIRND